MLMDQYGTKSKVVEDINRESTELQNKIMDLMRKAQMRGKVRISQSTSKKHDDEL